MTYTWNELNKLLKPCPLCGGSAVVQEAIFKSDEGIEMTIKCTNCELTLQHSAPNPNTFLSNQRDKSAIALWNTREAEPNWPKENPYTKPKMRGVE